MTAVGGADAPDRALFPIAHGVVGVDDRRVISGIIFLIKNRLRWHGVPPGYAPHKTIYGRFVRWKRRGRIKNLRRIHARYDRWVHTVMRHQHRSQRYLLALINEFRA
ncbi:MAG: transposase [Rhizobiales bacterium]|nr:transposase [Hyphomicrobiales bacterium]